MLWPQASFAAFLRGISSERQIKHSTTTGATGIDVAECRRGAAEGRDVRDFALLESLDTTFEVVALLCASSTVSKLAGVVLLRFIDGRVYAL